MPVPARNTLAIVGAGPIGLEAAASALERGFDVHVFERGEVGSHPIAWGHVHMFTPWRMNMGPASARLLARHGWTAPPADESPTGAELAERFLAPLAATPELKSRVHEHSQVIHIARQATLKGERTGDPARAANPFRLLVRDSGGRENILRAFAVIDASGTYASPNWAGSGGIPARGELYLAPQMSYHCDDVRGLRRARHEGKRTLVIGGGASAATTVAELAQLAAESPGTTVTWVTRETAAFAGEVANDSLPARVALFAGAHALRTGSDPAVQWVGGAEVEGFEYNSATHKYRVALDVGGQARLEEADQVIVNAGFGPDNSLYRELHVHESYETRGPMKLAATLPAAETSHGTTTLAGDAASLSNPEPDFFILGAKSYGRNSAFLLQAGHAQVEEALSALAARLLEASAR
jgi:thioredoxin reductase